MLKILGDISLADGYFDVGTGVGTAIMRGANPFVHLPISDDDFWIGNFECVCSDSHQDRLPFVISPSALSNIKHLNFYGVANNHVMQVGDDAYHTTLAFMRKNNILFAGSDECRSAQFEHQGKKVGIIAFSQRPDNFSKIPLYWHLPEYSELKKEIDELAECEFKIAFIHWGYEFINYPNLDQKLLAHWLIDNGLDLIIGMHPHVAQGMERYKGKSIFYSLGNSVFHMNWKPTKYGLLVTVDLSSEQVEVGYTKIDESGFPEIVKAVPQQYTLENLNRLLNIAEENEKYFAKVSKNAAQYRRANRKVILKSVVSGNSPYARKMIADFVKRRILKR